MYDLYTTLLAPCSGSALFALEGRRAPFVSKDFEWISAKIPAEAGIFCAGANAKIIA
jgi:hypothetical protein